MVGLSPTEFVLCPAHPKNSAYTHLSLSAIFLFLVKRIILMRYSPFLNKKVPTFIKVRTIQIIYNYLHVIIYLRYLLFLEKVD